MQKARLCAEIQNCRKVEQSKLMEMNQYPASIFIQILTEMTFLIYYKYKRAKGHPLKFTIRFEASQKSFQPVCLIFTRQRL